MQCALAAAKDKIPENAALAPGYLVNTKQSRAPFQLAESEASRMREKCRKASEAEEELRARLGASAEEISRLESTVKDMEARLEAATNGSARYVLYPISL